ncbi:hypothetical protein ASF62_13700 [Leifsonia sp. Leaf325]|nr:Ig-like domain-containing protein [Leifsonia sp. Leaf325]KQQ92854.1 hypothetical protein ASF62_13700 [Leifsonia sp. Leaf325]
MSTPRTTRRPARSAIIAAVSAIAVLGVVVTLAVTAEGYEATEVPRVESSVWVTRDSGQYARVNTDLAEIDTVRAVDDPNDVVQAGSASSVYSQGLRQRWPIDAASPIDLVEADEADAAAGTDAPASAAEGTPAGTREVVSAGTHVLYRTDTGQVYLGGVGTDSSVTPIDPLAEEAASAAPTAPADGGDGADGDDAEAAAYVAAAVSVSPAGLVALYSAEEQAVRTYDATTGSFLGSAQELASPPDADAAVALSVLGDSWVLLSDGRAWISDRDTPVDVDVDDAAVLQAGSDDGGSALIADGDGLVELDLQRATSTRIAQATGTPAQPVVVGDDAHAAWLGTSSGAIWSRSTGETALLTIPDGELDNVQAVTPVIRSNGDRAVLNETTSGLLWTLPDGAAIPLEEWSVDEDDDEQEGAIIVDDVAEPEPPVAVDDAFGVRSGQLVLLPVLLNDHDPNKKDVLTIDPASVTGLSDQGFGAVSVVGSGQSMAVRVKAGEGEASFQYSVTDGTATSKPATVTLTVRAPEEQTAPVWCGVEACQQDWPTPQVLPGGTVIVPVLNAWVDPEGDPVILSDARTVDVDAPVTVVPMADGRVAVRHSDPNGSDGVVDVLVTVTDAGGASAEKTLSVVVTGSPTLEAAPVAVTAGVDETVAVAVADHVTGGSGSFRLVDAVASSTSEQGLVVSPNAAAGEIELSASAPGQYVVTYSVVDTLSQSEQSAIVRLTVVGEGVPLSMAPLTAFVRAGEDTSVDVFGAVSNTTGRVLVLSSAESTDAALNVGVVDSAELRVSGSTADGLPGLIGRANVTVADGAGAAVTGTVAVFLAPSVSAVSPIALPDAVTVRAGALVRIPVTANDVSPRGARLVVSPAVAGSGTSGELAFAAGDSVRYLAPSAAGTYTIGYSVALESDPSRTDNTTITVTVLPPGANRAPKPQALSARVLTGQSVSIRVPSYGVDPDGDAVILVGTEQPPVNSGTASVSAEGNAIVYTAPGSAVPGGQLSFGYTVRDSNGAEASGVVRVGVLDSELADTAPVTFSDFARVQSGAATPVRIQPLDNDRDPAQGELELIALEPNAPAGTSEYDRLERLIDAKTSIADGRVLLNAGDVTGTNSYVYTVRSDASSSTAQGLIVVAVSDEVGADNPIVSDTVLTARTRGDLSTSGVDVLSGKVAWSSGDVAGLKLRLWGDRAQSRYDVDGWRITGSLPAKGDLVPFQVSATDAAGQDVVSYGFLRIPAFDNMRVQLKAAIDPVQVDEEKSATIDVRDLVDLPASDDVQLRDGKFTTQRAAATCTASGKDDAVYSAGREAPWIDSCLVPLRIDGQSTWSYVVVPVAIRPKNPQAILSALSRTIAPAASETVALYDSMTTWEGDREGDRSKLDYSVAYDGASFVMTQNGAEVAFEARADARPGTRETATVSVSAFGGLSAAITLVVGVAPADAPRGATFTEKCTVSAGTCSIPVVGVSGEYDPFAGKTGAGLKLVSIGSGGGVACDVATVAASGDTAVNAVFPSGQDAFGGECIVPFTVTDAQGRTGTGRLTIDVQGYPQRPSSISTRSYTGSSVTLDVALGEAARAHPELTGVAIYSGGRQQSADCSPSVAGVYSCTVSGLVNGEKHEYTARAVNSVGESGDTSSVTTWAYEAPRIGEASAVPVYVDGRTAPNNAVIELSVASSDDTQAFRIVERDQTITRSGRTTTERLDVTPGPQVLTIVPISRFQPPISGSTDGASVVVTVEGAGSPVITNGVTASAATNSSITVGGADANANGSAKPVERLYVAWRNGGEPQCRVNAKGGSLSISGGEAQGAGPTLSGLAEFEVYQVKACVSNGFGVASSNSVQVLTFVAVDAPSGDNTYAVATVPSGGGLSYSYGLERAPQIDPRRGFEMQYYLYGQWREDFSLSDDGAPGNVKARECRKNFGLYCSGETGITGNVPTTVSVEFDDPDRQEDGCWVDTTNPGDLVSVSAAARGSYAVSGFTFAADRLSADLTVTFTGSFAPLQGITHTVPICAPPPPPEPTPEPTPTETPPAESVAP